METPHHKAAAVRLTDSWPALTSGMQATPPAASSPDLCTEIGVPSGSALPRGPRALVSSGSSAAVQLSARGDDLVCADPGWPPSSDRAHKLRDLHCVAWRLICDEWETDQVWRAAPHIVHRRDRRGSPPQPNHFYIGMGRQARARMLLSARIDDSAAFVRRGQACVDSLKGTEFIAGHRQCAPRSHRRARLPR